jgi:hypothetical protein
VLDERVGAAAVGVDVLGAEHEEERRPAVDGAAYPHGLEERDAQVQPASLERARLLVRHAGGGTEQRQPLLGLLLVLLVLLHHHAAAADVLLAVVVVSPVPFHHAS